MGLTFLFLKPASLRPLCVCRRAADTLLCGLVKPPLAPHRPNDHSGPGIWRRGLTRGTGSFSFPVACSRPESEATGRRHPPPTTTLDPFCPGSARSSAIKMRQIQTERSVQSGTICHFVKQCRANLILWPRQKGHMLGGGVSDVLGGRRRW